MANKQYTSLIRLFRHCDIATGSDFNLQRAKKQLQAEFGIAQDGFIRVEGYTYTRQDVLEEINRPDFSKRLLYHQRIWESPRLLQWLETNTVDLYMTRHEFKALSGNADFDEFFSPYFAGPFSYVSRTLLANNDLAGLAELLAYEEFLKSGEREEAFRPVRIFLDESLRLLRNVSKENYGMMRPKMIHWIDSEWSAFFNNLPHEFYEIKNDIVTYLINIGVAVQKSHRKDCRKMSRQLVQVEDIPENLRQTISSNHLIYTENSRTINWRPWGIGFWVFIILGRFIAATDGCDNDRSDYKQYLPVHIIDKYSADSIFKKLRDSAFKRDSIVIKLDNEVKRY